ncbi:DISARM system phospholipase D-like protein DrmC [Kitasatospora sp. NPDC059817]|uniref:DISARM system phospholipase D-like protein DrmC n=1 Tax=Kitasatospora sp. NPDC059817 TaxID=3346961 RepID=UPI003646AA09
MSSPRFEAAAASAVAALGPHRAGTLATLIEQGRGPEYAAAEFPSPRTSGEIREVYRTIRAEDIPGAVAAAYLRGFSSAWNDRRGQAEVRTVWSGPSTPGVPVRSTARVLTEVVRQARTELLAMTYSARPYRPLLQALADATARGVEVHLVVETRAGAGGLLDGPEPAAAFRSLSGLRLWHWPVDRRDHRSARQHAKLAVADRQVLFLGSANLTESGVRRNLEAGTVVRGGTAPERAAEHIRALMRQGTLQPLPFLD